MKESRPSLTYDVESQPGEKLSLPSTIVDSIGPGRWIVTVYPAGKTDPPLVRRHDAFLNGYAPEEEGLY